jgi:hypothetical protein
MALTTPWQKAAVAFSEALAMKAAPIQSPSPVHLSRGVNLQKPT